MTHRRIQTAMLLPVLAMGLNAMPALAQNDAPDLKVFEISPVAPKNAPNVILILLDDVGFGAPSSFGGPVATPVFDTLGASGLRFNRFHTTSVCSPTRAALLTGRNQHRSNFGVASGNEQAQSGYTGLWPRSTASVAQVLRNNGYSTAAIGKWHNTPPIGKPALRGHSIAGQLVWGSNTSMALSLARRISGSRSCIAILPV